MTILRMTKYIHKIGRKNKKFGFGGEVIYYYYYFSSSLSHFFFFFSSLSLSTMEVCFRLYKHKLVSRYINTVYTHKSCLSHQHQQQENHNKTPLKIQHSKYNSSTLQTTKKNSFSSPHFLLKYYSIPH